MRDPPSGRVPEQAPERFLVATEACGGGKVVLCSPAVFFHLYKFIYPKTIEANKIDREFHHRKPL